MISLYGSNSTSSRFELAAEATSPRRNRVAFDPVTNALSALGATRNATLRTDVVHTLRCHFITTTKLSKNTSANSLPELAATASLSDRQGSDFLAKARPQTIWPHST